MKNYLKFLSTIISIIHANILHYSKKNVKKLC
nr:MAG TPA: hypothetical protein [Caudoviricetes sp.]